MNVRNARVEQAVEPFYQPENFELQLIRTHDSSLDRGVHRRCVTACCQDTDTFHNWTAKVFTILESLGSVYLFRRIENDLHCGDNSVLDRLQGFLNLFHTNAIVKNLGSVADRYIPHAASTLYHTWKGSVPKLSDRPNWPLMIL